VFGWTVRLYGDTLSPCQIMIVVFPGPLPFNTTSWVETTIASAIVGSDTETREVSSENCSNSPRPTVSVMARGGRGVASRAGWAGWGGWGACAVPRFRDQPTRRALLQIHRPCHPIHCAARAGCVLVAGRGPLFELLLD